MLRNRIIGCQLKKDKDRDQELLYQATMESTMIGWVGPITLRKRAKPELENERYTDISLRLSVQEVKNVSPKFRYFCEICLDRTLYARTTSKISDGSVFWGEKFELHNLPQISIITINLYKQGTYSTKDRKQKNKSPNQFIAFMTIPVTELPQTSEYQQWSYMKVLHQTPHRHETDFQPNTHNPEKIVINDKRENGTRYRKKSMPSMCMNPFDPGNTAEPVQGRKKKKRSWTAGLTSLSSNENQQPNGQTNSTPRNPPNQPYDNMVSGNECEKNRLNSPQIRLNIQYECIQILPLRFYRRFCQYLGKHSTQVLHHIEQNLSAKQKEVYANSLVNIYEKVPELSISGFISSLLEEDLQQNTHKSMLLRSNSMASKAVECYIKLVGHDYLQKLLRGSIEEMLNSSDDFEMDPVRISQPDAYTSSQLQNHQLQINCQALTEQVTSIWRRIYESANYLPRELHRVFCVVRVQLEREHDSCTASQVISSCLFLRFICPAILGPILFGLTSAVPESNRICRNLTMVAKVLQNLANLTVFGDKEPHMKFMNSFVENQIPSMESFLLNISTPSDAIESSNPMADIHMYIDLGYEFAKLASLFTSSLQEIQLPYELCELSDILTLLHDHTSNPLPSGWSTYLNPYDHVPIKNEQPNHVIPNASAPGSCHGLAETRNNSVISSALSIDPNHSRDEHLFNGTIHEPGLHKFGVMNLDQQLSPNSTQGSHDNSITDPDIMERLLIDCHEQLRQLNDCITNVSKVCRSESQIDSGHDNKGCRSMSPNIVNSYDPLHASQYDFGVSFEQSDMECKSEPLHGSIKAHIREGTMKPQSSSSGSPSFDQISDRLDELKCVLTNERQQLAQVIAVKTQAIPNLEESIAQLSLKLEKLRQCPNRSKSPYSAPSTSRPESPSHIYYLTHDGQDSTSFDAGSDIHSSSRSLATPTSISTSHPSPVPKNKYPYAVNHQQSMPEQPARNIPIVYNSRSSSFCSRSTHTPQLSKKQLNHPSHDGQNLYNLTRASEGTGIPLTELITTNRQKLNANAMQRRHSAAKLIRN